MKQDSGVIISVGCNNEHGSMRLHTIHILCETYCHHIMAIHIDNGLTYLAISIFFLSIITQIYITKKTNTRLDDTYVGYSYICITDTIYI